MITETATGMRCSGAALLALLTACAYQPQLLERPVKVWASSRSLDNVASCVIRVLDDRQHTASSLSPSLTHIKRVIEPGKAYEIRIKPNQAVTTEAYMVRLEKIDDRITRMSLFVQSPWRKDVVNALAPCGGRS